jgi:hypothetical protein
MALKTPAPTSNDSGTGTDQDTGIGVLYKASLMLLVGLWVATSVRLAAAQKARVSERQRQKAQ